MSGWKPKLNRRKGWREVTVAAEVPSAVAGANFIATITGRWRPTGKLAHLDMEINAIVTGHLVSECEATTQHRYVTQPLATQALINAVLQQCRSISRLSIEMYGTASLQVDRGDLEATQQYLGAQRKQEHNPELGADIGVSETDLREIFTNEADAKLWWIQHHPDKLDAIKHDGIITKLIETVREEANEYHLGANKEDSLIHVLAEFLKRLDNAEDVPALTTAFLQVLRFHGHPDLTQRVQILQAKADVRDDANHQDSDDDSTQPFFDQSPGSIDDHPS